MENQDRTKFDGTEASNDLLLVDFTNNLYYIGIKIIEELKEIKNLKELQEYITNYKGTKYDKPKFFLPLLTNDFYSNLSSDQLTEILKIIYTRNDLSYFLTEIPHNDFYSNLSSDQLTEILKIISHKDFYRTLSYDQLKEILKIIPAKDDLSCFLTKIPPNVASYIMKDYELEIELLKLLEDFNIDPTTQGLNIFNDLNLIIFQSYHKLLLFISRKKGHWIDFSPKAHILSRHLLSYFHNPEHF